MGRAYRGPYARPSSYPVPYASASVWGTGIDPIHGFYGEGPPLRVMGRADHIGSSPVANEYPRGREYQQPADSSGFDPPQEKLWGYPPDGVLDDDYGPDSFGAGADAPISYGDTGPATDQYFDSRPSWNTPAEQDRLRSDASTMASWGTGGLVMRAMRAGSHRYRLRPAPNGNDTYQPISAEPSNSNPTETVSEGWLNKVTSFVAMADPSDPSQYEIQTSMRQRFGVMDNRRAMMRATDEERARIPSRVMEMVEKVYSGGERHYDMDPFQATEVHRPFRYRSAGIGRADWMETNEFGPMLPFQRIPPTDPSQGVPEVQVPDDYGYTGEDTMYYA